MYFPFGVTTLLYHVILIWYSPRDAHDLLMYLSSLRSDANRRGIISVDIIPCSPNMVFLWKMRTVHKGRCSPVGRARTGAGIISGDIIPCSFLKKINTFFLIDNKSLPLHPPKTILLVLTTRFLSLQEAQPKAYKQKPLLFQAKLR